MPSPAFAQVAQPNDPFFPPMPGWSAKIGWDPPAVDDGGALIAVVDSGMWSGFDDFAGYLDDESADCVNKPIAAARRMQHPTDVEDIVGHGTQVATLAAAPANGKGSVGVSPNSHVLVVRVTVDGPSMACAFNYLAQVARTTGQAMIVNVSIEFPAAPSSAARVALDKLIREGALVVAASGNEAPAGIQWPANASHVLAVGRDDGEGAAGKNLDIVAPGAHMLLPDPSHNGWSTSAQGTSFAAPIVSGAAARVWGMFAIDDPQGVVYLLRNNAKPMSGRFGSGSVNIRAALAAGRLKLPPIEESEPNDTKPLAQQKRGCKRTCKLRGLVTTSDDNSDYWHLIGRSRCPKKKLTFSRGVSAECKPGHGGVFVRVRPRIALGLYTVSVPRG